MCARRGCLSGRCSSGEARAQARSPFASSKHTSLSPHVAAHVLHIRMAVPAASCMLWQWTQPVLARATEKGPALCAGAARVYGAGRGRQRRLAAQCASRAAPGLRAPPQAQRQSLGFRFQGFGYISVTPLLAESRPAAACVAAAGRITWSVAARFASRVCQMRPVPVLAL